MQTAGVPVERVVQGLATDLVRDHHQVDDVPAVGDVEQRRDVPGLQVEVDQTGPASGRGGLQRSVHRDRRGADPTLAARQRDHVPGADRPARLAGDVAADDPGPGGRVVQPLSEVVDGEPDRGDAAGAGLHRDPVELGVGAGREQQDPGERVLPGHLADQVQHRYRAERVGHHQHLRRHLRDRVQGLRAAARDLDQFVAELGQHRGDPAGDLGVGAAEHHPPAHRVAPFTCGASGRAGRAARRSPAGEPDPWRGRRSRWCRAGSGPAGHWWPGRLRPRSAGCPSARPRR